MAAVWTELMNYRVFSAAPAPGPSFLNVTQQLQFLPRLAVMETNICMDSISYMLEFCSEAKAAVSSDTVEWEAVEICHFNSFSIYLQPALSFNKVLINSSKIDNAEFLDYNCIGCFKMSSNDRLLCLSFHSLGLLQHTQTHTHTPFFILFIESKD